VILLVASPARAYEPAPPRLHPTFHASGAVDLTSLPSPSPGAEVALGLIAGANRIELRGAAWVAQPAAAPSLPGAGGQISLLDAGLRYCRTFVPRVVEVAGCGGFSAGAVLGRGYGVPQPVTAASPWAAPSLGVLGMWRASPGFAFGAMVEGLVPVVRTTFVLSGAGAIFRPAPVTGRALLGIEAWFR
jgi:hypothetical protein